MKVLFYNNAHSIDVLSACPCPSCSRIRGANYIDTSVPFVRRKLISPLSRGFLLYADVVVCEVPSGHIHFGGVCFTSVTLNDQLSLPRLL